jgi:hypothetical protein
VPVLYSDHSLDRLAEILGNEWRLGGVATQSNGDHIVILFNSLDATTRALSLGKEIDGWRVKEAGQDFAVLAKNNKEVRLKIDLQKRIEN